MEFLNSNVPRSSLFIIKFKVLPSGKIRFQKPSVNAEFLEFVIGRQSANHSWWPSLKAASIDTEFDELNDVCGAEKCQGLTFLSFKQKSLWLEFLATLSCAFSPEFISAARQRFRNHLP